MKSFREESATYQIAITKIISAKIFTRFLKENNVKITHEQLEILNLLLEKGGRSMHEVSKLTRKDNSATTRMIDILERHKFVKRVSSKKDRRLKLLHITEIGKSELMNANQVARKYLKNAIKSIDNSELEIFMKVIKEIRKNIIELGESQFKK